MPLEFDDQDIADINQAIAEGGDIWNLPILARLKRKIKDHFRNTTSQCCYCAKLFNDEFNMVIDIEHVLPQQLYPSERFEIQNLNIACKRCNMEIKGNDIGFIVDLQDMGYNYYDPNHYRIIHPNLDNYDDHLIRKEHRHGSLVVIKYIIKNTQKGQFTYDYFELKLVEVDTLNIAQGTRSGKTLSNLRGEIKRTLFRLLTRI